MEKNIFEEADKSLKKIIKLQQSDFKLRVKLIETISNHPVIKLMSRVQKIIWNESNNMDYLVRSIPYPLRVPLVVVKSSISNYNNLKNPIFHRNFGIKGKSSYDSFNQFSLLIESSKLIKDNQLFLNSEDLIIDLEPALYSAKKINHSNLDLLITLIKHFNSDYKMYWEFPFKCENEMGFLKFDFSRSLSLKSGEPTLNLEFGSKVSSNYRNKIGFFDFFGYSISRICRGILGNGYSLSSSDYFSIDYRYELNIKKKIDDFERLEKYETQLRGFLSKWNEIDKSLNDFYRSNKFKFDLILSDYEKFTKKIKSYELLQKLKK